MTSRRRLRPAAAPAPERAVSAAPVSSSELAEYLEHLRSERDVSPNTLLAYERDLSELVDVLFDLLRR